MDDNLENFGVNVPALPIHRSLYFCPLQLQQRTCLSFQASISKEVSVLWTTPWVRFDNVSRKQFGGGGGGCDWPYLYQSSPSFGSSPSLLCNGLHNSDGP